MYKSSNQITAIIWIISGDTSALFQREKTTTLWGSLSVPKKTFHWITVVFLSLHYFDGME